MSQLLTLSGAPEGYDAALIAREAARPENRGEPVIHIARDDRRMAAMRAALEFFAPAAVVLEFPAWDTTPYDRVSPAPSVMAARMAVLTALAHGAIKGPFILLTTLSAAMQRVPARETVRIPVLGPCQTGMHIAGMLGHKFSVVTVMRKGALALGRSLHGNHEGAPCGWEPTSTPSVSSSQPARPWTPGIGRGLPA